MVFQDAMTALNPVKRLHQQMAESISLHARNSAPRPSKPDHWNCSTTSNPITELRLNDYPHPLSAACVSG